MSNQIINEKGLLFLARVILNFAETVGKEKAIQIIKNDPSTYIGLLSTDQYGDFNKSEIKIAKKKKWLKEDLEKLKLTELQSIILETIIAQKNSATLKDLEKSLEQKGVQVNSGSMIGGSLAGISKKCESCNLPPVYKAVHGAKGITYSIVDEAKRSVANFLN